MEAIKKKMQAMKLEKDNAIDRADTIDNSLRMPSSELRRPRRR